MVYSAYYKHSIGIIMKIKTNLQIFRILVLVKCSDEQSSFTLCDPMMCQNHVMCFLIFESISVQNYSFLVQQVSVDIKETLCTLDFHSLTLPSTRFVSEKRILSCFPAESHSRVPAMCMCIDFPCETFSSRAPVELMNDS